MIRKALITIGVVLIASAGWAAEAKGNFIGEKITYAIKQMGIKAGDATLSYVGPTEKDGKQYVLIIFLADGLNFYDEEKIYMDPQGFYPQIVERDLNIFGSKERITEYYDAPKGVVRIVKAADGKTSEQVIEKPGQLDNIYCFIYRYRRDGNFKVGDTLTVNLPTLDLKIKLEKETRISAAGKKYDAFFMQSDPSKYRLWFDKSDQRLPLRIDGAVGVGSTSMSMRKYESKGQ